MGRVGLYLAKSTALGVIGAVADEHISEAVYGPLQITLQDA